MQEVYGSDFNHLQITVRQNNRKEITIGLIIKRSRISVHLHVILVPSFQSPLPYR